MIVQKYVHDLDAWEALTVEEQELVVGRRKLSDIELDDVVKPSNSHVAANTIVEADGTERNIMRENMPFGHIGGGEFGTYFIGYSATPDVTELMLERMFVGDPPGNYDRILDFSTALTGSLFSCRRSTSSRAVSAAAERALRTCASTPHAVSGPRQDRRCRAISRAY